MKTKIAIIGAGVSGLRAAQVLNQAKVRDKIDLHIFEADDRVGGRVKTDNLHGYQLDHGFQIFLPAYPEVQSTLDLPKLKLKPFSAGAYIRKNHQYRYIADPLREPLALFSTLTSPIGTVRDKLKILKLKTLKEWEDGDEPTEYFLRKFGFSYHIINEFFRPFFSGIFLERKLKTPTSYFLFLYNIFSKCYASLPVKGIGEIPNQMAESLEGVSFHFKSPVKDFSAQEVEGEKFDYVINTIPSSKVQWHSVTTDYFLLDKFANKSALYLNGTEGVINHIAPLSKVATEYRGENQKELLSVNLIGENYDADLELVRKEMNLWFPHQKITHLKRFNIEKALPKLENGKKYSSFETNGVYTCGDFQETPSLNGALASGRKVGEAILKRLNLV